MSAAAERTPAAKVAAGLTYGGYRAGALAARVLPGRVAAALDGPVGLGASLATPARRAMIERHLRRVDPALNGVALRRAVQRAFESYARYYLESFRLPALSAGAVDAGIDVDGYHHVTEALEQGNGVILALPHLGGWEWAGRWMADRGHRLVVVVERLEPPELFDWFAKLRADLGMVVVPLGGDVASTVLGALNDNQIVCLLCDRDIDGRGVRTEFFGEATTLPGGPATLSLRTGAPVLPAGVYYTSRTDGHFGLVRPPVTIERSGKMRADVATFTQALARELELLIRRAPDQWHLFQPNWPSDPGYQARDSRPLT